MELRAHGVVPGAINIPVGYVNEGGRTFQPQNFQPQTFQPWTFQPPIFQPQVLNNS